MEAPVLFCPRVRPLQVWLAVLAIGLFSILTLPRAAVAGEISLAAGFFIDGDTLVDASYTTPVNTNSLLAPTAFARGKKGLPLVTDPPGVLTFFYSDHSTFSGSHELIFEGGSGAHDIAQEVLRWEKETLGSDEDDSWDVAMHWKVDYKYNSSDELTGFNSMQCRLHFIHEVGPHTNDSDDFEFSKPVTKHDSNFKSGAVEKIILFEKNMKPTHPKVGGQGAHRDHLMFTASFRMLKNHIQAQLSANPNVIIPVALASTAGGPTLAGSTDIDPAGPFANVGLEIEHKQHGGREVFRSQARRSSLKLNAQYASFDMGGATAIALHDVSVASAEDFHGDAVALGTGTELLATGDVFDNPASAIFVDSGAALRSSARSSSYEMPFPLGEEEEHFVLEKETALGDGFLLTLTIEELELETTATGYEGAGDASVGLISDYSFALPSPFLLGFMGQHLDPEGDGISAFVTLTDDGSGFGGSALIEFTGSDYAVAAVPALPPAAIALLAGLLAGTGIAGLGLWHRRWARA